MIKARVGLCVLAVSLLSFETPSFAQQATADMRGIVTDQSGAGITDAHVTLTNTQTALSRSSQTLGTGEYSFVGVPAGNYILLVEKAGFAEIGRAHV